MGKKKLIKRWDAFLENIDQRFDDILDQAAQGTAQMIPNIEYDSISISNAWSGIKAQMRSLQDKSENTWDDKMDELFGDRDDVTSEQRLEQLNKYEDLNHQLEQKYERAYVKAMADAGRKIYNDASQHVDLNKIHNCKQCGDKMDIKIYSFMAKNVKCLSCGTVNSYEPDPRIQALESYTIDALAAENVIEHTLKESDLSHRIHRLHDLRNEVGTKEKEEQLRKELIETRKEKVELYYSFFETNVPDKAEYYRREKEERLKWAEDTKNL